MSSNGQDELCTTCKKSLKGHSSIRYKGKRYCFACGKRAVGTDERDKRALEHGALGRPIRKGEN